jgi:ArsR family metal-binding transcriptional regulator
VFIEDIWAAEVSPCLADSDSFRALAIADISLNEVLPYLNAVIERGNYQPGSNSFMFKKGIMWFAIRGSNIDIMRFANMTELYEIIDWLKELINNTYVNRDNITPLYEPRKIISPFTIFKLLPQTNCKECGEQACMAFAIKLSKNEVVVTECIPLLKSENAELLEKLENEII